MDAADRYLDIIRKSQNIDDISDVIKSIKETQKVILEEITEKRKYFDSLYFLIHKANERLDNLCNHNYKIIQFGFYICMDCGRERYSY